MFYELHSNQVNIRINICAIQQFVIRNASLVRSYANVITFCNGDLNTNTKQTTRRGWGLNP